MYLHLNFLFHFLAQKKPKLPKLIVDRIIALLNKYPKGIPDIHFGKMYQVSVNFDS
jgi:hypothetical protein